MHCAHWLTPKRTTAQSLALVGGGPVLVADLLDTAHRALDLATLQVAARVLEELGGGATRRDLQVAVVVLLRRGTEATELRQRRQGEAGEGESQEEGDSQCASHHRDGSFP